ncbi:peptidylprolyl isomerase [Halosquirtibacter xylanolyticus]|uniref:peptidylprolyl isomerase n=1 Tax=Halosquirtibacter xylanolyticus TaxID=3374599 RepID=UPI003748F0FA|nr:peptidylprolyl isomerase [Prolixibacteraceae bacterium]
MRIKKQLWFSILIYIGTSLSLQGQTIRRVKIETSLGNMEAILYNDTPKHRDKFIKEADQGYYDGAMFYRVIKDFMIQAGAKGYQKASHSVRIGYGDPDFTVDDEIRKTHFAKRGALCAPRQPDEKNPFKQSDISQFFIIQGKRYRKGELDTLELIRNVPIKKSIKKRYWNKEVKTKAAILKKEGKAKEYNKLIRQVKDQIKTEYSLNNNKLVFTKEQRDAYIHVGGYPGIDGEYTIFGELVSGFDVLDKISKVKYDKFNRPWSNINIKVIVLE